MADCEKTLRELETFLDGELSEASRSTIHDHLEGCPDCLSAFDFQSELKSVIATKCRNDEMPPGLLSRLEQCLQTELTPEGDEFA